MSQNEAGGEVSREPFNVRKGPAFIVVGIALFIIIGGGLLATLPSNSTPKTTPSKTVYVKTGNAKTAKSPVDVISATTALTSIRDDGALPSDIENALIIPAGSTVTGTENYDSDATQFDRAVVINAPYSSKLLVKCYQDELPLLGWTLSATQPDASANGVQGTEVLAQHTSSDGYYWEVGVIISQNAQSISPALSGGSATSASSTIHLELVEEPDGD